jgi:ABC-type phosphate transport system substrate-binding protein
MNSAKYAGIWTKKAFRDGLTAPAMKSGDAEVIEFVKRTPGAVGYVSSSPSGVNIVK